ncbi:MAG: type III pantothenate kinase [Bacteroidales bacterium]
MNLVIDAGNTRIKLALFVSDKLVSLDAVTEWSEEALFRSFDQFPGIKSVIISSVRGIPEWVPTFFADRRIPATVMSAHLPMPIRIGYESPGTLGKDRIAAAVAAAATFPGKPVLAIGAGTALTFDLVLADGLYPGGNISPGMRMRFKALHEQTASLPLVEPVAEVPLIGRNTREAILAGVINGMVYEIDNSINSLRNKYNDLRVILTGGDAAVLSKLLKNAIFVTDNLVLIGLNRILMHLNQEIRGSGAVDKHSNEK